MMLQILGVGLSRTGTTSLTKALAQLGFQAEHYCWEKFRGIILAGDGDFRLFDSTDAVTDIPAAYYHQELTRCYPGLKYIQTVRGVDSWWESMRRHCQRLEQERGRNAAHWNFVRALHKRVYGSPVPDERLYKDHYAEFNRRVVDAIPPDRLLTMNMFSGDGWDVLCHFLDRPLLTCSFPHENRGSGK